MLKLEDREWKEFKIGDIFSFKRGERQVSGNRKSGNIPYYSASDTMNGLTDMISNPSFIEQKDSIICTTFGQAYFVKGGFSASDEITILHNEHINKYSGIFIVQTIMQNKEKYNFGHKAFSKKLIKDKILLPTTIFGIPDYDFMEQYIKEREELKLQEYIEFAQKEIARIEKDIVELNTNHKWAEFYLRDLFKIFHGKRLVKEKRIDGETPLLTASATNEGVSDFISNEDMVKYRNVITIDMFGHSFYHKYECVGDDNIYFLINDDLCDEVKQFISVCINRNSSKYSYGKQFREKNAMVDKVLLPIKDDGTLDVEYMTQYIYIYIYGRLKSYLKFLSVI